MSATHLHVPTGKRCTIQQVRADNMSFCNFGDALNPFTWVKNSELVPLTTVELLIPDDLCSSIMCTALEGGIGYWCAAGGILRTPGTTDWEYIAFDAYDAEDPSDEKAENHFGRVTYETIRTGIANILSGAAKVRIDIAGSVLKELAGWPDEGGCYCDAEVADCIVQAGLFGELVYG